jgi:hypothetical protein
MAVVVIGRMTTQVAIRSNTARDHNTFYLTSKTTQLTLTL